jgi:hypothetical protein
VRRTTRYLWALGLASLVALPLSARAPVRQLPISAFLDAQPSDVLTAWHDPATHRVLRFDGFGKRAEFFGVEGLGTAFEGSVTVRELPDGRAHVSVLLHTINAICWGYQGDESETTESYVEAFGYAPYQVAEGAAPSLGDGLFRVEFLMRSPDRPMPHYYLITPDSADYTRLALSAVVNCSGQLQHGSGYPDGTPGMAHTAQVGLFAIGAPGGCPPETDANCYPSERIVFWPTGPR